MFKYKNLIVIFALIVFLIGIAGCGTDKQTGFVLEIKSIYSGNGEDGQPLESREKSKTIANIQRDDIVDKFLERNSKVNNERLILKITNITDENIEFEYYSWGEWTRKELKYNEKFEFMPGYDVIYDGLNQHIELYFTR